MSTIYVIIGSTGEYSDRDEWLVKAVTNEDRAKALVTALCEPVKTSWSWSWEDVQRFKHPLDSQCRIYPSSPRCTYYYKTVELEE